MCSGGAPDADPNVGAAALAQANLSKEQLDWAKSIYAEQAPDRADSKRRANLTSDAQLQAMQKQTELTDDYANYQKSTFRPLEKGVVEGAFNFDTESKRDAAEGKAAAGVQSSFDNVQDQAQRNLSRMGVNPSSGRALATSNQLGIQKAMALAGAANKARTDVELQGYARKMDAANMGRNLASNQATSAGVALSQGNSAVTNGMQSGAINAQGNSLMQTGFSGASNSMASAGNLYGSAAQIGQNASKGDDALMGMVGSIAGKYVASDVRIKTDIRGINPDKALQAVTKTPVSSWKYKPGSHCDDGGKEHTGPMAQDVRRTMGERAAPGGTKIDLITMNGVAMAAIQALSKKVDRLAGPHGMKRGAA